MQRSKHENGIRSGKITFDFCYYSSTTFVGSTLLPISSPLQKMNGYIVDTWDYDDDHLFRISARYPSCAIDPSNLYFSTPFNMLSRQQTTLPAATIAISYQRYNAFPFHSIILQNTKTTSSTFTFCVYLRNPFAQLSRRNNADKLIGDLLGDKCGGGLVHIK